MGDFCTGTRPPVKACILLDLHRKLFWCESDPGKLSAADPDPLLPFSSRVLNPNSTVAGDEEVKAAARTFRKRWR